VVVCHPGGRAACGSGRCSWIELDYRRPAEAPGARTWTLGRDEMARVLAAADKTQGTPRNCGSRVRGSPPYS
jgi:hypothetical protein